MGKILRRISTVILILYMFLLFGCQSNRLKNNIQKDLDDLQKQIFELQQDQAYINTKVEQAAGEVSHLHERLETQEKRALEILQKQGDLDKNIKTIKESLAEQSRGLDANKKVSHVLHQKKEAQKDLYLSPRRLYDRALELILSGEIDPAIPLLYKYLELYPRTELADNAQYWLGESYYKKGDSQKAIQEFKKVLADYPSGNKSPAALLKIGYAYYDLKQTSQALESLKKIIRQYPDDPSSALAQKKIDIILSER